MPTSPPRVLLVEDEFLIRLTLSEALADEGFDVIEANDGAEALRLLKDGSVSVMLTDIQLPGGMDGPAIMTQAREILPELPVVFMSGRPDSGATLSKLPRTRFVAKPYRAADIVAAIRSLIA
jgi:CheY-like chemotaxis protein